MNEILYKVDQCSLTLKNVDKIFWPDCNYTKGDLLNYYDKAGPILLPYIKDRPFTMVRYPDGVNGKHFYQKQCPDYAPTWIRRYPVTKGNKTIDYCIVNKSADILWLVNQGCIDMHTWLANVNTPHCPDWAVVDLDPAEGTSWQDVLTIAVLVRQALAGLALTGYAKTSGSSGLHIYVPLQPIYSYGEVQQFVGGLAKMLEKVYPEKITTARKVKQRKGKVYIDYLQNGVGRTMASVYSVRPVSKATVSMPVSWQEIEKKEITPDDFNIGNALTMINHRNQLFDDALKNKQQLKIPNLII